MVSSPRNISYCLVHMDKNSSVELYFTLLITLTQPSNASSLEETKMFSESNENSKESSIIMVNSLLNVF